MKNSLKALLLALIITSCAQQEKKGERNQINILSGPWRFTMNLNGTELPFNAEINTTNRFKASITIKNGEEKIFIENVDLYNDSIFFKMPYFDSEFVGRIESPELISGKWINHQYENYSIPFSAIHGETFRFTNTLSRTDIHTRYKVEFQKVESNTFPAILQLKNDSGRVEGTFLTETGDYRFLVGNLMNENLYLSTFDGSHAYYFKARIEGDSLKDGIFKSGTFTEYQWSGEKNNSFQLAKPDTLTYLKPGFEFVDFSLPNQEGTLVSWEDLNLDNKTVIIDITGSWCPNCLDANRSLAELSRHYSKDELVILPITFELSDNLDKAKESINRMKSETKLPDNYLFGGKANKKHASEVLPMLNKISAFPTLIFIGPDRQVAKIHTGFSGPGTGEEYDTFMSETKNLLDSLVAKSN